MVRSSVFIATTILALSSAAWAQQSGSASVQQLQVPSTSSAINPGQIAQPPSGPQAGPGAASVNEVQGNVDLCERILAGQSPPIPGLNCNANALQAPSALTPSNPASSGLNSTIDAIGRDPSATSTEGNGIPPIVILH